jgi:nucleotide-binding universal stress UspA family protein
VSVLRRFRRTFLDLIIIHAVQTADSNLPMQLDLDEQIQSEERQQARQRIADLQRRAGSEAPVRIVLGPIKGAQLEATRQFDADLLMIGRSPESGEYGRIRDLTYALIRDSPFPVLSIWPAYLRSINAQRIEVAGGVVILAKRG